MMAGLEVIEAGPASSFQDSGRFGFLSQGVSPAGPCDPLLHAIANRLVGNVLSEPAIEYTIKGDSYRITVPSCQVAMAGDFIIEIDGKRVDAWRSHTVCSGQILRILHAVRGVRGYLAVAGGFAVDSVLGSASTHARSGIGPFGGNLRAGDIVLLRRSEVVPDVELEFDQTAIPDLVSEVRIVLGPQDDYFGADDIHAIASAIFTVTPQSDRMGCQLSGPPIYYRKDRPLISEGIALGSIQVPGDGLYIVALNDRQTVGGYPKIATVVSPDIRKITQAMPGTSLRFRPITIDEAMRIARERHVLLESLCAYIAPAKVFDMSSERLLSINLISGMYADGSPLG